MSAERQRRKRNPFRDNRKGNRHIAAATQGAPETQSEEWVIAIHLCPGDDIDHQKFYDLIEQTIAEKYPTFSGLLGMRKVLATDVSTP